VQTLALLKRTLVARNLSVYADEQKRVPSKFYLQTRNLLGRFQRSSMILFFLVVASRMMTVFGRSPGEGHLRGESGIPRLEDGS
jgi:hypothetical protein